MPALKTETLSSSQRSRGCFAALWNTSSGPPCGSQLWLANRSSCRLRWICARNSCKINCSVDFDASNCSLQKWATNALLLPPPIGLSVFMIQPIISRVKFVVHPDLAFFSPCRCNIKESLFGELCQSRRRWLSLGLRISSIDLVVLNFG